MRERGRVTLCGAISQYNRTDVEPAGMRNMFVAVERGITLRGFLARMYESEWGAFQGQVGDWLANGKFVFSEDIRDGLPEAPQALIDLLRGANVGKTLVRISSHGSHVGLDLPGSRSIGAAHGQFAGTENLERIHSFA